MRKPEFLGHMFVARAGGFFMDGDPPVDLLGIDVLQEKNSWLVLASVTERAKRGNFSAVGRVVDIVRSTNSAAVLAACSDILSYVAPYSVLRRLLAEFHEDIFRWQNLVRTEFVLDILRRSMGLWTVPHLLDVYMKAENREAINLQAEDLDQPSYILLPSYISELVENEPGLIDEAELDDPEYGRIVEKTYDALCKSLGSPERAVLRGEPFSVGAIARALLNRLAPSDQPIDELAISEDRMLFEASTGIDCREFFKGFQIQPLAAAAIMEEFFDSAQDAKFEAGVRYFFGHRIMDQAE